MLKCIFCDFEIVSVFQFDTMAEHVAREHEKDELIPLNKVLLPNFTYAAILPQIGLVVIEEVEENEFEEGPYIYINQCSPEKLIDELRDKRDEYNRAIDEIIKLTGLGDY